MGLLDNLAESPLFNVGMGLLANSGPSRNPVNPWGGVMQGLLSARQARQERVQMEREAAMQQAAQFKMQQDMARDAALKQWGQQYDAQHPGAAASLFPDLYAKAMATAEEEKAKRVTAEMSTAGALGLQGVDPNLPVTVKRDGAGNVVDYSLASAKVMSGGAKGPGFQGNSMEAQAIEQYVSTLPPEQQNAARLELTKQYLTRPTTTVTPDGTYVRPGFTLPGGAPVAPQASPEPMPSPDATTTPVAAPGAAPTGGLGALIPKPATESQSKAKGFHDVMKNAGATIDALEASGYDRSKPQALLPNAIADPITQQYNQAESDWVRAKLRWESGAAIGKDEMEQEIKRYFPQIGESAAVVEQKRQARREAEAAMLNNTQGGSRPNTNNGRKPKTSNADIYDKYGLAKPK